MHRVLLNIDIFFFSHESENIKSRYSDIAECGFAAADRSEPLKKDGLRQKEMLTLQNTGRVGRPAGLGG